MIRAGVAAGVTVVLCVGILAWTLQLWRADLAVPFGALSGDDAYYAMVTKSLITNPWYLHNAFLGAPAGVYLQDFPIPDTAHLALMKFLSLWTRNYAVVLNLFFLLSFPLTAVASLFGFRILNLSYGVAIACSLLFTFLPYHFFRGETHVFLASYYSVPLMVALMVWMGLGVNGPAAASAGDVPTSISKQTAFPKYAHPSAKLICVLVASAGTYYAVFGSLLLFVAAAFRAARDNALRPLIFAAALASVIVIVTVVNLAPTIMYAARHGINTALIVHTPGQAEYYGLKVLTLILPVTGHRIPALAKLKAFFNSQTLVVNENDWASLGVVATIGFLMLLGWLICRPPVPGPVTQVFDLLSALNIGALLLAVTGGFAILIVPLIPEIRSYNRMSVYIAFFSLTAVGVRLDHVVIKRLSHATARWAVPALVAAIVVAGIFDQTTSGFVPPYATLAAAYARDTTYFQRVEASLPKYAMVFELPYAEYPGLHRVWGYELLRGYLHSDTLRWSYGAMSGRPQDLWLRKVTAQPVDDMLDTVALAGFDGIYIDRSGYADHGTTLIAKLRRRLSVQPLVSTDRQLVFFNLDNFRDALRHKYGEAKWRSRRQTVLRPLDLQETGSP